jgi:alkylation response protein AidB-like acyl-CoA dehydrogenase
MELADETEEDPGPTYRLLARRAIEGVASELGMLQTGESSALNAPDPTLHRRFDEEIFRQGWAGLWWPKVYGGGGKTLRHHAVFTEEAARLGLATPFNRVGVGIVAPALLLYGSEDQKQKYLKQILSVEQVWCQGFSEPDAGSDLASLRTRAEYDGRVWRISGQKIWTTLGHLADFCFLLARTGETGAPHHGITAFLLPMDQQGVDVRPIRQLTGDNEFSEIFFDGAVVATENLLGGEGNGWRVAMGALGYERSVHLFQRQVQLRQAALTLSNALRESSVGESVLDTMIDIELDLAGMRFAVAEQLDRLDAGEVPGIDGNATKVLWSETSQRLGRLGTNLAMAYPDEFDLRPWLDEYHKSLATSIYAGANEIQRNIIAERGLGLPR